MRRVLPLWSSLIAVLLLSQWVAGAAACLPRLQDVTPAICHVVADGDGPGPAVPADHGGVACALCASLPPVVLAGPGAVVPGPRVVFVAVRSPQWVAAAEVVAAVRPQQARAPPVLS